MRLARLLSGRHVQYISVAMLAVSFVIARILVILVFSDLLRRLLLLLFVLTFCPCRSGCWLLKNLQDFVIRDLLLGFVLGRIQSRRRSETNHAIFGDSWCNQLVENLQYLCRERAHQLL